ncbi:hypothetical protein E4U28_000806 [Claviceps purpurea]|nr:hypothetical protein E4U28_000806 [Claviceps purpurea]
MSVSIVSVPYAHSNLAPHQAPLLPVTTQIPKRPVTPFVLLDPHGHPSSCLTIRSHDCPHKPFNTLACNMYRRKVLDPCLTPVSINHPETLKTDGIQIIYWDLFFEAERVGHNIYLRALVSDRLTRLQLKDSLGR